MEAQGESWPHRTHPAPRPCRKDRAPAAPGPVAPALVRGGFGCRNCLQWACGFLGGPRSSWVSLKFPFGHQLREVLVCSPVAAPPRGVSGGAGTGGCLGGPPGADAECLAGPGRHPRPCSAAVRSVTCHSRVCPRSRRAPVSHRGGACPRRRPESPPHARADGRGQRGWGTVSPCSRMARPPLLDCSCTQAWLSACLSHCLRRLASGDLGAGSAPRTRLTAGRRPGALLVGNNALYKVGLLFIP